MCAGLVDGHLHATLGDHHAHAVVSVDHGRRFAVAHHLELGDRLLDAALDDAVVVDRLQPTDAMRIDAPLVGSDEDVGTDAGILFGDTDCLEHIDHEGFQEIERYPEVLLGDLALLLTWGFLLACRTSSGPLHSNRQPGVLDR